LQRRGLVANGLDFIEAIGLYQSGARGVIAHQI
jgi:hypothetical protein